MFLIPLTWVYDELLLKYFSGVFTTPHLLLSALFGLSAGLMWAAVLGILGRGRRAFAVIALLNALVFTIESVLRSTYPVYFSPAGILAGAGNVAAQYRTELLQGIRVGAVRMILFSLPVILSVLWRIIRRKEDAKKSPVSMIAAALTMAILLHYGTATSAIAGPYGSVYGAQYNFNDAAEAFGLTTALRLEFCYKLFGNPYEGFHMAQNSVSAPDAEETGYTGAVSETAEPGKDQAADGTGATVESTDLDTWLAEGDGQDPDRSADSPQEETLAEEELPPPPSYNVMDIDFTADALQEEKAGELSAFLASREPSLQNEYTGLFRGKNLIMICAEAYCDAFIRPELTPTLWRLSRSGFYFSDFYQPSWGGSTTTGELSMVEGLDSTAGDEAITDIADHNHYFTMGNQLQRLGYFSLAFHNGSHTFYHRDRTHENLGYDAYLASGQHIEAFCGHSYPTDSEMIEGTVPAYIDHQPFSIYYMTISGHAPYERNSYFVRHYYDQVNAVVGDEYYEKTKYYICYQMELESALASLVKGLEDAGIADDTVIVLVGDHYPYGLGNGRTWHNDRDYIDDLIKADDVLYWNEDKNGLIIWSGCLENQYHSMACEISDPVSSLDILPTISNLFGVEFDSRLLPGRDVFAENTEPLVFWNNLSWITREGKYDSRKKVFYPAEEKPAEEEEEAPEAEKATPGNMETEAAEEVSPAAPEPEPVDLDRIHHMVENMITMCSRIEKLDYYGLVFGPDETAGDPEAVWTLLEQELAERNARKEEEAAKEETTEETAPSK